MSGFSLIELLVIIAIIVILAGLLLPALSRAKAQGQKADCVNHMRQLTLAWKMYADDNRNSLAENYYFNDNGTINPDSWIRGSMDDNPAYGQFEAGVLDSTNAHSIKAGKLFTYIPVPKVFRCPSDPSTTDGVPRVNMNRQRKGSDPIIDSMMISRDPKRSARFPPRNPPIAPPAR